MKDPRVSGGSRFFITQKEVGHGQEESEEGKEVCEEEEKSSRPSSGREVHQADGCKAQGGGKKESRAQENGRPQARAPRDPDGGAPGAGGYPGAGSIDGGHPRRQDRSEPGCGLAVSDGVPALMGGG
ncbi:MAG TPA: hypothetical protein VI319_12060 [Burkholderiales bacterium]